MTSDGARGVGPVVPPSRGRIDAGVWRMLGLTRVRQLTGGQQARVMAAQLDGRPVIVKLTEARHADHDRFVTRMRMLAELGVRDPCVVAPIAIDGELTRQLGDWHAVVFPFVAGQPPRVDRSHEAAWMGTALAQLHRSLADLGTFGLPPVDALDVAGIDIPPTTGVQLLHGDFSASNIRLQADGHRVFDFDDCGYGPVEFDVANSLYMVLFDATMHGDVGLSDFFRGWFVDAYRAESGLAVEDALLDQMIRVRCDALAYWVDHPTHAPIGIRTSTSEWLDRLRWFLSTV